MSRLTRIYLEFNEDSVRFCYRSYEMTPSLLMNIATLHHTSHILDKYITHTKENWSYLFSWRIGRVRSSSRGKIIGNKVQVL